MIAATVLEPPTVKPVLYERFFAGDPLTRARFVNGIYPTNEVMERVRAFLRDDTRAES